MKLYKISWCYDHAEVFVEAESETDAVEKVMGWFEKSDTKPVGRLWCEEIKVSTYEDFLKQ